MLCLLLCLYHCLAATACLNPFESDILASVYLPLAKHGFHRPRQHQAAGCHWRHRGYVASHIWLLHHLCICCHFHYRSIVNMSDRHTHAKSLPRFHIQYVCQVPVKPMTIPHLQCVCSPSQKQCNHPQNQCNHLQNQSNHLQNQCNHSENQWLETDDLVALGRSWGGGWACIYIKENNIEGTERQRERERESTNKERGSANKERGKAELLQSTRRWHDKMKK